MNKNYYNKGAKWTQRDARDELFSVRQAVCRCKDCYALDNKLFTASKCTKEKGVHGCEALGGGCGEVSKVSETRNRETAHISLDKSGSLDRFLPCDHLEPNSSTP